MKRNLAPSTHDAAASGYARQDEMSIAGCLSRLPSIRESLGGDPGLWRVREIGDGNLNLVFLVEGTSSSVIVKQALPFVRMVGESWPLPISRAHFEHCALRDYEQRCPGLTPRILHHDALLALTVMEHLQPHIIMRHGIVAGTVYPGFADAISTFLARSLFFGSDLSCAAGRKKERAVELAGNVAMCKITEDLVFTEPYFAAANNRWTSPQLDDAAAALRHDEELIVHATRLKYVFLTHAEANIHGDLHTGSIMVCASDTRVIDAEFAFCGPLSFDVGVLLANLLMGYCAQRGHESAPGARDEYRRWLLSAVEQVWHGFKEKFLDLWRHANSGDAFCGAVFDRQELRSTLQAEQAQFMQRVFHEALGFAGLEIIRRIVGLSHIIDFERIADEAMRARCELSALSIGRRLVVNASAFESIESVTLLASHR